MLGAVVAVALTEARVTVEAATAHGNAQRKQAVEHTETAVFPERCEDADIDIP